MEFESLLPRDLEGSFELFVALLYLYIVVRDWSWAQDFNMARMIAMKKKE